MPLTSNTTSSSTIGCGVPQYHLQQILEHLYNNW
jgi:hypothetical protein